MVRFSLREKEQARLENLALEVIKRANKRAHEKEGIEPLCAENGHNHNNLDTLAMAVYAGAKDRYAIYMEGGILEKPGALLLVADPMDGSGKASLLGPYCSPLTTTVMLLDDEVVVAAAAGTIWPKTIYGIDEHGLYRYGGAGKKYLLPRQLAPKTIRVSAFLQRAGLRGQMLEYLSAYQSAEEIVLETDGGGLYPLLVAQNTQQLHAAAELKPVPLYEHITAIMTSAAGCCVSQADGSELLLDPHMKQTSLTACSPYVQERLVGLFSEMYRKLSLGQTDSDENYLSLRVV